MLKKSEKPKKIKNLRFHTGYWTAMRFKKLLGLKMPTDNIMELSSIERVEMLEERLKSDNVNEGKSYEKLLIFISGNLDEAFKIADAVEDNEGDADIYHELSKRVSIINIKNALSYKFKPEQIARFGNNHVIYPCLDKKSYYKIIQKNCFQILNRIQNEHNIIIELSDNIYDVIYRNGVFPTQGVRPVISTVFNVLGSNLPHFLYIALINDIDNFYLDIENKTLFTKINNTKYEKEIILDIDSLRENKSIDETTLITVHEIGHALAHAILFNTPPKQINVNAAGFNGGFVINHDSIDNKTFIRNQAAVYLGGLAAEEIVFGEEFKSSGSSYDILTATDIIGKYVRAYGMDMTISRIIKKETQLGHELNFNIDKTNDIIEMILMEEKKRIGDILNQNLKLYKALVKFTLDNKNITIEQFFNICKSFNLNLEMREINDKLIYKYNDNVKNFLSQ
jgi:cell division protease FtsH